MEIDVDNIATAHEMVVARIMKTCREVDIETSPGKWEKTWEYPDLVTTIIRHPQQQPQVSEACNFGPGFIAQYKEDMCHFKPAFKYPFGQAPVYTYPWRLFDYPMLMESPNPCPGGKRGALVLGNGNGKGINQIDQIVKRLQDNQESRRANAITWVPEIDGNATHDQPCLQVAHFMVRDGVDDPKCPRELEDALFLHGRFFFRSHDMLGGAGANWVGLCGLMELIAGRLKYLESRPNGNIGPDEVGVQVGSLTTCSSSAHLYWKRDEKDLDDFRTLLFQKYRMYL